MLTDFSEKVQKFKSLIDAKGEIVIVSHHNPDGDALGSMLGLYHVLKLYGVESSMILPNAFPAFLKWLPDSKKVVNFFYNPAKAKALINNAKVLFAVDFNSPSRLEEMGQWFDKATGKKVLIDHHPFPEPSFHIAISDTDVSSTAELVYEFALELGGQDLINYNAAISLFVGIMTDTGSFSYSCSYPRTFEIAAQLIQKGVKVEDAQRRVYNTFSADRMRLLGYALEKKMRVFSEHNAAYISLTRKELVSFNHKIGDTEGLVNQPLAIQGIVLSALFVENDGYIKVSLRSRGQFPANKLCKEFFNGGGHINAAGGKSFHSLEETEKLFEKALHQYHNELTQE